MANKKNMKVKVFEQCDPVEAGSIYGVCDWCEDYEGLCEDGCRPLDNYGGSSEVDSVRERKVGEVFWTKAVFTVPASVFGVEFTKTEGLLFDPKIDRIVRGMTAEQFVKESLNYVEDHKYDEDGEISEDYYKIYFECYCYMNFPVNRGHMECSCTREGDEVWRTVFMKHTVCEDCVKTEFMWNKK